MRKLIIAFLAFAVLITAAGAYAEAAENLVVNGDFSSTTSAGYPSGWHRDMWYSTTGISYLSVTDEGLDGAAAEVFNADENDASWAQVIAVEPNTAYRLSCMVKAQSVGEGGAGANISIKDTFCAAEAPADTNGDWVELELYGKTGPEQTELTVFLRVGGYGNLNSGRAWFDNVEFTQVDAAPADAVMMDFTPVTNENSAVEEDSFSAALTDAETAPTRYTEAFLLVTCAYVLVIIAVTRRTHSISLDKKKHEKPVLFGIFAIALIVRLFLAYAVRGYNTDINCFSGWSERIYSTGLVNFYEEGYFCDYPPGYMLMLWPIAMLRSAFGITYGSDLYVVLLKLIPIACDLIGAYILYAFAKKTISWHAAALLCAFYALNPAIIVDSAAWGQIDSVFTLFLVLCALEMAKGRPQAALPLFAASVLIKPQALLFAPLGLVVAVWESLRAYAAGDKRAWKKLFGGLGLALLIIYLTALPFSIKEFNGFFDVLLRPFTWLIALLTDTTQGYSYLTVNTLNLYELLNKNWASTSKEQALTIIAWLMFVCSYAYSIFLFIKSKESKSIFLTGGLLIALIYAFGPMIHERYIFPAILLLSIAYAQYRDKRLFFALLTMSATLFLNEVLVLQGGMTAANYGHLQTSEQWLNATLSLINVLNTLWLGYVCYDILCRGRVYRFKPAPAAPDVPPDIFGAEKSGWRLHLKRIDYLLMAGVTLIYSVAAFTNLGTTKAPQTSWVSSAPGESVTFDLGQTRTFRMTYYGGICTTNFTVSLSEDGVNWTEPFYARYDQGEIFRWLYYVPLDENMETVKQESVSKQPDGVVLASNLESHPMQTARYVRIQAVSAGLTLCEVGFLDDEGNVYAIKAVDAAGGFAEKALDPGLLVDEQDTVPAYPSYYNSTYFDEIYHARTAYEHLHGLQTYEYTHPPLGKVLMMIGIKIFGMTPFGWRFMGTMMGVLMLPMMYLIVKQLTKRTDLSMVAMFLFSVDSMHFTQTRIATIDSYAVFFIMVMYFFMLRYWQMDWNRDGLKKTLLPLGLCGVFMGVAWATKWIGIYASVGLAILFFWTIALRVRDYKRKKTPDFWKNLWITLGFCVLFFIVVPLLIYYFSYYWHMQYEGGLTVKRVVELQKSIFNYHAGLTGDTHYFRSEWYEWPVIAWPMWFYSGTEYLAPGMISSISCMGNPAVWWFGLFAMLYVIMRAVFSRKIDRSYLFVLIGFASQYLPWVLVPRSTFIYHYFASVPFIIIATVLFLNHVRTKSKTAFRITAGTLMAVSLVLFVAFYPLESGMPVSRTYAMLLRWFNWYNF